MKKIKITTLVLIAGISATLLINSCAETQVVASKTGSQLWGENCIRCHNAPPSNDYSSDQWEVIGAHMRIRANTMSEADMDKIVAYLKTTE